MFLRWCPCDLPVTAVLNVDRMDGRLEESINKEMVQPLAKLVPPEVSSE